MDLFNIGEVRVIVSLLEVAIEAIPVLVHVVELFVLRVREEIRASISSASGGRSSLLFFCVSIR